MRRDPLQAADRLHGIWAAIQSPANSGSEAYSPDFRYSPADRPVTPVRGIFTVDVETNDTNVATFIVPADNMPTGISLVASQTELTLLSSQAGWIQFSDITWKVIGWTDRVFGGRVNGTALNLSR